MPKASCSLCHKTWAKEGVKLFHVPKCDIKRKRWSDSCSVDLKYGTKICALHFSEKDFMADEDRKRARLDYGALPKALPPIPSRSKVKHASTQTQENPRLDILETEVARLRRRVKDLEMFESRIGAIFTEGQMRKIYYPDKGLHWSDDDMHGAIALHATGPKAYTYMYEMGYPLPCESAIRKYLRKMREKNKNESSEKEETSPTAAEYKNGDDPGSNQTKDCHSSGAPQNIREVISPQQQ